MKAMVMQGAKQALTLEEVPVPEPGDRELLVRVLTCGICRTDLHIIDGELSEPGLPLIMGHQIVGIVEKAGPDTEHVQEGDRVGIPWLGGTCGHCFYCEHKKENLCDHAVFTGYQKNGGYAEYTVAHEGFCFTIPESYDPLQAAPLLCAGLIGYRSYRMCGNAQNLGFYGFGNAATILAQLTRYENKRFYAFTRPGDAESQAFAKEQGAVWAGDSDAMPPEELDAAIIFAPVGALVPQALKTLRKGGSIVCAGIHMSDIPSFPYNDLWGERILRSVANLTRRDGEEFLEIAPKIPIQTRVQSFKLEEANEAIRFHREGHAGYNAVLSIGI